MAGLRAARTIRRVQAQLDRLAPLSPGGDQLGLERITALLDRLGRPQDRLAAGVPRRRHQRQGLDLRLPPRRARGGRAARSTSSPARTWSASTSASASPAS